MPETMTIVYGVFIFLALGMSVFLSSCVFWILLNRQVSLGKAIQGTIVAGALNKIFLTGSGYALASAALKNDSVPLYKSLASFAALELFSVLPWIIAGLYFGAQLAARTHWFLIVFFALAFFFILNKRKRLGDFISNAAGYFKGTSRNILAVAPLALLNIISGVCYYWFLFKVFGVRIPWGEMVKLIAISFTMGYLSPLPSGLGIKESGMTFLLMQTGVPFKQSVALAVADRLVITLFYAACGFLCGWGVISDVIKTRSLKKK
ncbi:MAG: flippase-like domain-containing protein [Candidatus Omnitrophota bacterium]